MWKNVLAAGLSMTVALPAPASAGPIQESARTAARQSALAQADAERGSRSRFWTSIALISGGGALAALGSIEIGDDETGPDNGEDLNGSDDGEDADGWGNKALLGGGIAAATAGAVLLITGRSSGPVVSARPGSVTIRQTVRF
jgi:hypothetical protein